MPTKVKLNAMLVFPHIISSLARIMAQQSPDTDTSENPKNDLKIAVLSPLKLHHLFSDWIKLIHCRSADDFNSSLSLLHYLWMISVKTHINFAIKKSQLSFFQILNQYVMTRHKQTCFRFTKWKDVPPNWLSLSPRRINNIYIQVTAVSVDTTAILFFLDPKFWPNQNRP